MASRSSQKIRVVGVMNGTSLDGIDYVLCEFQIKSGKPHSVKLLDHVGKKFPSSLRDQLMRLALGKDGARELSHAHFMLGRLYAEHLGEIRQKKKWKFELAGIHGQTVDHDPPHSTYQIGSMPIVAETIKVPVVFDFRSKDVALGGQGAPLAPLFHAFLLRSEKRAAFVNLGGIANVTFVEKGNVKAAFDTGPANILMDSWLQKVEGNSYDVDGRLAARGIFSIPLLKQMMEHPYFHKSPPKSTGRELFNLDFLKAYEGELQKLSLADQMATLCELSASTVAAALKDYHPDLIFVSGGGAHNRNLMKRLRLHLPDVEISTSSQLGWPVEAIEGGAFAYLALMRHLEIPLPLRAITGGKNAIAGSVCL